MPPSPYTATDVEVTGRMTIGESRTVALPTANKLGLILFDATAGQRVSLKVTASTITNCRMSIYRPDGTRVVYMTANTGGGFMDTPQLPTTGSYTISVDPDSTYTGSLSFTLYNATDATGTITPGGAAVTVTTTIAGQNSQITFSGTMGQRVSLKISGVALTGGSNYTRVYIKKPDGTNLANTGYVNSNGDFIDVQTLPV